LNRPQVAAAREGEHQAEPGPQSEPLQRHSRQQEVALVPFIGGKRTSIFEANQAGSLFHFFFQLKPGLPDGIFAYPKSLFGYKLEVPGMKYSGTYILWPFGAFGIFMTIRYF
jgi:hypothetical protein